MAETANGGESGSSGPVMLGDRYKIDPAQPLKELAIPSATAFAVEDRRDPSRQLFALICTPGIPSRTSLLANMKGNKIRGQLPVVDWNVLEWPAFGQSCMCIVYERPLGGRVSDTLNRKEGRVNEYDMPRKVIEPLATALRGMTSFGFPHRSIRPTNMFWLDEEQQEIVMGDCCATPPAFDQPAVFEPIERSMAQPAGRGEGGPTDDLYSMGVSLVFLMLGHNPVSKLSQDEVVYSKMEHGSYATLCGKERIPVSMLEPLRGMLSDDPQERWDLESLEMWVNGRRQTPMQKKPATKAESPFNYNGRDHITSRTLAHAFSKDIPEAARTIKGENFDPWLRRSLKDVDMADAVAAFVETAKANSSNFQGSDELLVTKATCFMDPVAPLRYKTLSFLPEGFGPTLAVELLRKGSAQMSAEILAKDIFTVWFAAQRTYNPDHSAIEKALSQLKAYLVNNDPGYGVERCLYELNVALPCQSSIVAEDFVVNIKDLLFALDDASKRTDTSSRPMDRHLCAFIAARFNQDIEPHLKAIASPEEDKSIIGILSLLAFLQWRLKTPPVYGLASWLGSLLTPAITAYHSRSTRRDLEREIPNIVRQGSLPDLFDLIDNPDRRREDEDGFRVAVMDFAEAEAEVQKVEESDSSRAESAERLGQQAAAMTSIVIAMIVTVVLFIMEQW